VTGMGVGPFDKTQLIARLATDWHDEGAHLYFPFSIITCFSRPIRGSKPECVALRLRAGMRGNGHGTA